MKITPLPSQYASPDTAPKVATPMRVQTNFTPGREAPPRDAGGQFEKAVKPDNARQPPGEGQTEDEQSQPLSPQYAALAKQKRALQLREKALADKEAAGAAGAGNGTSISFADLKANILQGLRTAGISYDDMLAALKADQNQSANPEVREVRGELKTLKEELAAGQATRDANEKAQVIANIRADAGELIKEGDTYEMIREGKHMDDVIEYMERHFEKTGELLDTEEALNRVETQLVEEAMALMGRSKLRNQAAPQKGQTLNSRDGARTVLSPRQRALAAFNAVRK